MLLGTHAKASALASTTPLPAEPPQARIISLSSASNDADWMPRIHLKIRSFALVSL